MITLYSAKEAKKAADEFYGPLSQIFDYIRDRAKDGLYVVNVRGVQMNSKQIGILQSSGYSVEQTLDGQDNVVYVVKWDES